MVRVRADLDLRNLGERAWNAGWGGRPVEVLMPFYRMALKGLVTELSFQDLGLWDRSGHKP